MKSCLASLLFYFAVTIFIPLNVFGQKPELVVQKGHLSTVFSVSFSHDGKMLATVDMGGTIKLWDVATGSGLRTLVMPSKDVFQVKFSPNGQFLASVSRGALSLWDVETGKVLHSFEGNYFTKPSVSFSPDSKRVASGQLMDSVKLWEVSTGAEVFELKGHPNPVVGTVFSPDGKTLISADNLGTIKFWDLKTGAAARTIERPSAPGNDVALSPDGKFIANRSPDGKTFTLWDVGTGTMLLEFEGSALHLYEFAFSPDGKRLAGANQDGTFTLWVVSTGRQQQTFKGGVLNPHAVAVSPDGKTLAGAISGKDSDIGLWEVGAQGEPRLLGLALPHNRGQQFSSDGLMLALMAGGGFTLWDLKTGAPFRSFRDDNYVIDNLAFSPDGKTVASSGYENKEYGDAGIIKLWDVQSGKLRRTFGGGVSPAYSVVFSPDGKTVAKASGKGVVTLWDAVTGEISRELKGDEEAGYSLKFSPDGKTLVGIDTSSFVSWDVSTGAVLIIVKDEEDENPLLRSLNRSLNGSVTRLAVTSDLKTIVSYTRGGLLDKYGAFTLWDFGTGKKILDLKEIPTSLDEIVLSPDGKTIAGVDSDQIRLWDTTTGAETRLLKGEGRKLVFSPDGRFLISNRSDSVQVWDVAGGRELGSLFALGNNDWMVITPDGLFDGSPNAWNKIIWRAPDKTSDFAPVESYFNEYFDPELLAKIFAGKAPRAPTEILNKDRRRPQFQLYRKGEQATGTPVAAARVDLRIEVTDAPAGAHDLRLFRNGSLVKVWRGDVLRGQSNISLEASVPIVAGKNHFTAYAFNRDSIKGTDATLTVEGLLKRPSVAYVLAIGVNKYANPAYNLSYSVADAKAFGEEISRWQGQLGRFERTEVKELLNEQATKKNILASLHQLKEKAQPEDAVMIYFAGHGTAEGKRFYLIPHDLGYRGARDKINTNARELRMMLEHSISDRELEEAVRGIDAGQMLFVIDACNSGQALEAEEKRRGPMNSAGLAQLAYEKGMYILTASQSYQFANESPGLGHGYLTYALVEKGLKSTVADSNKDGVVDVREWFVYATEEVPRIYEEQIKKQSASKLAQLRARKRDSGLAGIDDVQRPRVFYRREVEAQPLIVAKPIAPVSN